MPTTASADFSQFVVTTANETVCETSRDKPVSLSSSTCLIYAHELRLPFGLRCFEPAYPPCTPYIRFLFVRLRFRYPFFSPTPHDVNLGSRYGVRRQLRPLWTFTTDWQHARHTQKGTIDNCLARCYYNDEFLIYTLWFCPTNADHIRWGKIV